MWRRARTGAVLLAVVGALLILAAGPAAAAPELRLSPNSGPPGSTFLVTGTGFAPSEVVIRWRDEAGDELGRAVGPDFALEVTAPDGAPPDSYPVVAVVTDGGSASTLSTSFEVTASEPTEPPATTSTTVEEAPVDTTPDTRPSASPPSAAGGSLSRTDSVGGGVDGGMADTTGAGGEAGVDVAGARGTGAAGSTAGGAAGPTAGDTTTTTAPGAAPAASADAGAAPPPVMGAGPGDGPDGTGTAREGAGDASGSALAPRPTSESAGGMRNPLLLFVGLGMVFFAGVILAVRNRQRTPGPPPQAG